MAPGPSCGPYIIRLNPLQVSGVDSYLVTIGFNDAILVA